MPVKAKEKYINRKNIRAKSLKQKTIKQKIMKILKNQNLKLTNQE